MIKLAVATVYFVMRQLLRISPKYRSYNLVVLVYHEVIAAQKKRFTGQMDSLCRYAAAVFADVQELGGDKPRAAVTFDDGFEGLLDNALPILQQRHIPCTLFIPSGHLGRRPGWIRNPAHKNYHARIMDPEQIKALSPDRVLIASHSARHADLTTLAKKALQEELSASKTALENIVNRGVELLAFPYGAYDEQVAIAAEQAGYRRIFSADPVWRETNFLMGRVDLSPDDWPIEFHLKIRGAYQWLPLAIKLKKNLFHFHNPGLN
ncbi:MAG: polysaccharide deacetylase family protein [Gammaproteobacteria bacterium]|nr:polysaccharide deacetylase family protein [Gammaproteobacteria bacterium]